MTEERKPAEASRRGVLSAFAGTGVAAALGSVASNPAAAETASITDVLSLGTFESDLDGWTADGDVVLSRVARSDRPVAVTEGEFALDASVEGEAVPAISRPVSGLDLLAYPHFVADVAPGRIEGTDAPVTFRFRLYRLALDGSLEALAESDPVTVRQATPGRVFWDASDVDAGLLDAVARLEIDWYPADADPGSSGAAYTGGVVLDDVRAAASVDPVSSARLAATMRDLQFEHGAYERTAVTDEFDGGEAGAFAFADGATEPYRFETLADDRFRLTVAGTEMRFGGGWP